MVTKPDENCDLTLLRLAALEAGHIARRFFQKDETKTWNKSQDKSILNPVTEADIAINDFLAAHLRAARPDYGWLSEETKDDGSRQSCEHSFIIDPIDGTRAFIDGRPHFTICIAVLKTDTSANPPTARAISGVVYNPMTDEMYSAQAGQGATLNDSPITPSPIAAIENCAMIGYPRKFRRAKWPDMNVTILNSMAYRIVRVASGQNDATVSFTPKSDWDLAAAVLIAQEAGAMISDLDGHDFNFADDNTSNHGVICAGPKLYPLLLQRLNESTTMSLTQMETKMSDRKPEQLLHIVIGGELIDPMKTEFINLEEVIYIGAYPNYSTAYDAWKNAAQTTVDNAHMRFFILHAHELIDPDHDGVIG